MAVNNSADFGTGLQLMRQRKRLAEYNFVVAPGHRQTPLPQMQQIQLRFAIIRQRDQQTADRIAEAGNIDIDLGLDPCFQQIDTGNFSDPPGQPFRGAFKIGKHISQSVIAVIILLSGVHRFEGGYRHDIGRHPAGNHQGNRQGLTPHAGQIAQQFALQRAHQLSSCGAFLWVFWKTSLMWPSLR